MSHFTHEVFEILRAPVVTEKAVSLVAHNQYVFRVRVSATKKLISLAVEKAFGVKVEGVNTLVRKRRACRFRGRTGWKPSSKIAFVRLAPGYQIDTSAGV